MSYRTAKLASAICAGVLAGALVATTLSSTAARAADDCLAKPKEETPEGSHWYYRIDHATKRQCWYLREEGEKAAPAAPVSAASPARPVAPKAETAPPHSLADAHAELPPQARIQPAYRNAPPTFALPANPPVTENAPRANPADADPPPSVVASRWPGQSDATAAASPAPENSNLAANVVEPAQAPAPPPAIAAVPLIPTDAQGRPGSIAILLGVIIAALALASLIAGLAFKIGRSRRARLRRARRGAIWQRADDHRTMPLTDVLPRRAGIARDLDRSDDPVERIEEFISQLARQART